MFFPYCNIGNPLTATFSNLVFFLFFIPATVFGKPQKNYFPQFRSIAANVLFWEKVYAQHPVNTAVLHDKNDLNIIYEIIPLLDKTLPGAQDLNGKYLKKVKKKYADTLKSLAAGVQPRTVLEKRVYSLFSPPNLRAKFKKASENLRTQRGLQEQFIEGVVRSGAYLSEMKKIFRNYGLPEDLAYLPHVESSFNIHAYSKYGAAGMWQFTRATGKEFMTINHVVDERRDPIIATHAAARYLKRNFTNLGSWPLAITAYNYGHAGMQRALKQEGNYERIFKNYREGHFKFASRNFYAEFLAARNVAKKLEKSKIIKQHTAARSIHITLKGYASPHDISNHFNISPTVLRKYNPSLLPPVWRGEKYIPKGFKLKLPDSVSIRQLTKTVPRSSINRNQKKSTLYTVKQGDTAGKIAIQNGVSLTQLIETNNLGQDAFVYVGQKLRLSTNPPPPSEMHYPQKVGNSNSSSTNAVVVLADHKKVLPSRKVVPKKVTSSTKDLAVSSLRMENGTQYGEITVQPQESMGMYAEWLKVSKKKLYILNEMASSTAVHPGQRITLFFNTISKNVFEKRRKKYHKETLEDFFSAYKITGFQKYQVAMGDTLWGICQNKFGLPLWLLKVYNHNLDYNELSSNQHLQIPIVEAL